MSVGWCYLPTEVNGMLGGGQRLLKPLEWKPIENCILESSLWSKGLKKAYFLSSHFLFVLRCFLLTYTVKS